MLRCAYNKAVCCRSGTLKLKGLGGILSLAIVWFVGSSLQSATVKIGARSFEIPDGYGLKLAIEPGLTERPIVVDFDHDGHLYVAESSGTNEDVQKQLEEKPHSILRLTDTDGDGVFDKRTVFADRMMFPEGVLWHRGSVYVSAPPQIWKLTDTDVDGVADEREVWFDAKTLTGCANDLHGPYLGVDGWIYWCKGAFAEQRYDRTGGKPFVTRAAHIFRRRPEGGLVEPVMTGGMDNPVEVVFTETGERIFNTTFFQHPANGRRDGLVHAIYGGVYGKQHGVIDDHPRTGSLMPVMTHLGAAAPSGLARLESEALGFKDCLLTACFNLHSVTRHQLVRKGSTYKTNDTVLVSSDDLDFHPTDVIEDADGSVLIIDTGGWYKLCCPTSQLHKPDVAGAIYRLVKLNSEPVMDCRGSKIKWKTLRVEQLVRLLVDNRAVVSERATEELASRGSAAIPALRRAVVRNTDQRLAMKSVWAACRINTKASREVVRLALHHEQADVRQAAAHATSVWRDLAASARLIELLGDESPHVKRAAAEAIGRLGAKDAIPQLLVQLDPETDRTLQHSLIHALIEIEAAEVLRPYLAKGSAKQKQAALTAIVGMQGDHLSQEELVALLSSNDIEVRSLAASIAKKHPEWSQRYVELFRRKVRESPGALGDLSKTIGALAGQAEVDQFIVELLSKQGTAAEDKSALLEHIPSTVDAIEEVCEPLLRDNSASIVAAAVRKLVNNRNLNAKSIEQLSIIAKTNSVDAETRLIAACQLPQLDRNLFALVMGYLSDDHPRVRSLAVNVLENAKLEETQLLRLATKVGDAGALEISRLLRIFEQTESKSVGKRLFRSLVDSPSSTALPPEQLAGLAKRFGDDVQKLASPLLAKLSVDAATKSRQLNNLLTSLPQGDVRRGQKMFHDQTLACFTCHSVGYRGGKIGPDLSRIARTRSRHDLLEAIVYPSASFVRSYEPVIVATTDGRQWSGTIRDQSDDGVELQLNATETKSISTSEIEEILPGSVSIMPSGLEKQLSLEQLADLLAFLESRK